MAFIILFLLVVFLGLLGLIVSGSVKKIKQKSGDTTISIRYPVSRHKTIDTVIRQLINNEISAFKSAIPSPKPNPDWQYELTIDFKKYQKGNIKSYVFTVFSFTGGAHPMTRTITRTFDLKSGRQLVLSDLFDEKKLLPIIRKDLETRDLPDKKWIFQGSANLAKFALTQNDLLIYYDPYEVGPYVNGPQIVKIPLEQ